jgi:hypothetical protein
MGQMNLDDKFHAAEMAREALVLEVNQNQGSDLVGALISIETEEHLATYLYKANVPGYLDWHWAVTVAKVDEQSPATICDVVLLPGESALLAPEWIPYKDRLQAGDLRPGDLAPTSADDARLVPGYAALPGDEELDFTQLFEFGLGRVRVLSIEGRDAASKRWYEGEGGPSSAHAQQAPKSCQSCGFFLPIAGSLRSAFGVCANAIAPNDGRVVSVDHGCGAHSEALVQD